MTYSATYDPADDKLRLSASSRLDDDLYRRVKEAGFRWAPMQKVFYAVWNPAAEDICIELAGEIDDEDTTLVERAEARADRFEGYSENRTREAESAHAHVDQIAQRFEGGQPILVGHHSERKARKDAERIENGMRKALKLWDTASYWTERAAGGLSHAKYLERPDVRARRIKGLESDIRVYRSKFTPASKQVVLQQRWNESGDAPKVPHVYCAPRGGRGGHWVAVDDLPAIERHYSRWITHCENRLAYERAMLAEQGATDLLKPKPRSKAAQLPLCNYRAPGGLQIENIYRRGEMIHYPQVEMTQAAWNDIYSDYKGTRVVGNSHRVRTAMIKHQLNCVFITDSKTHTPPAAIQPEPQIGVYLEEHRETYHAPEPTEAQTKADALRAALKTGVQVVAAPQLFPTPADLAERMVELADIQPGMTVLEPSAGTGNILLAIKNRFHGEITLTAVELNMRLASILNTVINAADHVRQGDFLEMNGDLGKFDRIVMNPPFEGAADIDHILHARRMLRPGGQIVAICAGGPRQEERLKPIADLWEPLPPGTFKESGTNVNTVLLTVSYFDQDDEGSATE